MLYSAIVHKEDEWYVAECPEVGTASQGVSIEEAVANLKEATELYLEEFPEKNFFAPSVDNFRGSGLCLNFPKSPAKKQLKLLRN